MAESASRDIIAASLAFCLAAASPARAQAVADETPWADLESDPSRTELFNEEIIPIRQAADARTPESPATLAIPKIFYFPNDVRIDAVAEKPRKDSLFGIDISHYTKAELDHHMLRLQGVRFTYVKATQGVQFKDGKFDMFWDRLHALDPLQAVSVGAYHFLTAGDEGKEQGKRFLDFIDLHGGLKPGDMPPCLDLEWDRTATNPDRWTSVSPAEVVRNAVDWLDYVEQRSGRRPMIYTAETWLEGMKINGDLLSRLTRYPMWIADYSNSHKAVEKPSVPPGITPVLWQFASDAHLTDGYVGSLDANVFYGSEDEFVKTFGINR